MATPGLSSSVVGAPSGKGFYGQTQYLPSRSGPLMRGNLRVKQTSRFLRCLYVCTLASRTPFAWLILHGYRSRRRSISRVGAEQYTLASPLATPGSLTTTHPEIT